MVIRRYRRTRLPFRGHRRRRRLFSRRFRHHRRRLTRFKYRGGFQDFFVRQTYDVPSNSTLQIMLKFDGFQELAPLKDIYEAYRFMSCVVKVTPKINVASSDRQVDHYVSAPYHRLIADPKSMTEEALLSLDKSREYHGASTSTRRFVPAIVIATSTIGNDATGEEGKHIQMTDLKFRPRVEIRDTHSFAIPHYCGLYTFGGGSSYQITIRSRIRMYNQKLNTLN
ncbi:structural protein [Melipona quadrifasciata cyclovirus 1]|nr:structural protein [Melipona quadrifasciata cyclovirus 1]